MAYLMHVRYSPFINSFRRSKLVSCISYILPLLTACDVYTDMKPVGVRPFFYHSFYDTSETESVWY